MTDGKTYIFPEKDNLSTMALLGNGGGFGNGMWNNPFMYLVWMWMMRWMNNGEWGNNCTNQQLQTLQDQMQDNHNSDLIMQGINGNAAAIKEVADRMCCDCNALQQAICGVQNSVQQVAGQVGFSAERVINAVNSGDCRVIEALNNCCCNTQKEILRLSSDIQLQNCQQTNTLVNAINQLDNNNERGFNTLSFQNQTQSCNLQNTIKDTSNASTTSIIAKLDQMQNQNLLDKIDALREKNSEQAVIINNAQQSTIFGQMIAQATAPLGQALTGLSTEVASIKCRLPETVTLPSNSAVAVPVSGIPYGGLWGSQFGWGGCSCNNSLWG